MGGLFVFRPPSFGGQVSPIMVSGISMQPTMYTGDLAIAYKQKGYAIGDVIAFDTGEGFVIHRIVGGTPEDGFIMQGDNNSWFDPWEPTSDEIVGKAIFFVPKLGALFSYLQDPLRMSIAVGVLFFYISLASWFLTPAMGSRQRRQLRRARVSQRRAGMLRWLSM